MGSIARLITPTDSYVRYTGQLIRIRRLTEAAYIDLSRAVKPGQIENLKESLRAQRESIVEYMKVNGIRRAARDEEGDSSFDLLVNHTALLIQIDAVLVAVSGIALVTIPPAETSVLKNKMEALRAEITVI